MYENNRTCVHYYIDPIPPSRYTSRILDGREDPLLLLLLLLVCESCVLVRRRLRFPMRWTRLLPTASTAPLGASSVGPCVAASCTLNRRMPVPFQTPTVPGVAPDAVPTTISLEKINPQSRDSYHPIDSADHSKEWTRMGEGSETIVCIAGSSRKDDMLEIKVRASGFDTVWNADSGTWGVIEEMMVRTVWRGSSGSHDSS